MSRAFLQSTLLSLAGTQARSTSRLLRHCHYYSRNRAELKMPVIAAVIAHHRHHFCQHLATYSHSMLGETPSGISCSNQVQRAASFDHAPRSGGSAHFSKRGSSLHGMNSFSSESKTALLFSETEARRFYSKGKDKIKGSNSKRVVVINEEEMSEVIDVNSLKEQLETLITHMKDDYTKQLSIRGAAGALETLEVEYEGEVYPLQELAQVGRKNPQLAVLNLSSLPDACQPVLKAILDCGMNLNPQQEGTTIYVPLPKVTREHRENLAKAAKVIFTKYKGSLQNVQNRYIKQCKSQKEISEDLNFNVQQQIMKLTEVYILDAERLTVAKQKELLDSN